MNVNNFENHINKTILDRGYIYYMDGNILETTKQGDNEYIFLVEGSEDYQVVINIDEQGEIIYSECDCPYDFGPICKHQVAAYYELLEVFSNKDNKLEGKREIAKQPEIKEILSDLSKEELIRIILDITEKDVTLKNSLIVRYSRGNVEQQLIKCKNLIDSIVRKYTKREGFIKYRETSAYVYEMEDLLEKARDTYDTLLSLDIAFLLLNESIEAFQYADDSDGEIGSLVTETIEFIGEIAINSADLDIKLREEIFNNLLEQSDNNVFEGWEDYKIDILRLCTEFADVEYLREKLKIKIEHNLNKNSDSEYKRYINERMLQILFELIEDYGTEEEVLDFMMRNLKFTSFRQLLIDKYIEEKNYNKVIELAVEGEKQDKEYAGLILKWKKLRYEAYKKLLLKEEQEKLGKELLIEGNFEYYSELKELAADKEEFYKNLKEELKKGKGWYREDIYLKLITSQNDIDEIMEFVRENPSRIEEYAGKLQDKFKDEVIEIYKRYIKHAASYSSNRKDYQRLCGIIKRYKKISGNISQEEMINELMALYRKRPAFLDELSKIK